ncbi:MAG: GDSL-type esterase/lipase family protein [Leptolyngbyaceae cyanobacterium bins.302]|nr:GDSL-type esterase/lipase family protein [Leptolyngbyaceae cyanobacterium bins.302]
MSEPLFFAATALAENEARTAAIATQPSTYESRSQRVQAEKERLDRILVQLRKNVHPEANSAATQFSSVPEKPRSGSQLFAQRSTALAAGAVHTRLPARSYQPSWTNVGQQPTYQQWRSLLAQEANQVKYQSVGVLLGDSLSLWFPSDRLPQNRIWLNQAISGDTTGGILNRLSSFAATRPQVIYLMAGVNDLKQGASDRTILHNLRQITQRLRQNHPQARIVVQSILPTRSLPISSQRIVNLNRQLQAIAGQNGAYYLDVHSQMADQDGYLRSDLTTDGLHLNANGYAVWQAALSNADTYLAKR